MDQKICGVSAVILQAIFLCVLRVMIFSFGPIIKINNIY